MSRPLIDFLRRSALNPLTDDQIRSRAYEFWLERAGGNGDAISDWHKAEEDMAARLGQQLIHFHEPGMSPYPFIGTYRSIASYRFDRDAARIVLGTRAPRRCTLCLRQKPDAKFKKEAHVIPEGLGNKWLTTWDECDDCNGAIGRGPENALGAFLAADRAVSGTPTKRGTAKHALASGRSSIGGQASGEPILIDVREGDPSVQHRFDGPSRMVVVVPGVTFQPAHVFRSVAHTAWHLLDETRQLEYEALRDWILGKTTAGPMQMFRFYLPGMRQPRVGAEIWENVSDPALPPLVAMVFSRGSALVMPLVRDPSKGWGGRIALPPVLRSPYFPHIPIIQVVKGSGESKVKLGPSEYAFAITGDSLIVSAKKPVEVMLHIGDDVYQASLTTPPASTAKLTAYSISAPDLLPISCEIDPHDPAEKLNVTVSGMYDAPIDTVLRTLRLLLSAGEGTPFIIKAREDGRHILTRTIRLTEEEKETIRIAIEDAVATERVAAEFGLALRLAQDEVSIADLYALLQALDTGRVAYELDEPLQLRVPKSEVHGLLSALDAGADIKIDVRRTYSIGGQSIDPGPASGVIQNARLAAPAPALDSPDGELGVTEIGVIGDRFEVSFDRWRRPSRPQKASGDGHGHV